MCSAWLGGEKKKTNAALPNFPYIRASRALRALLASQIRRRRRKAHVVSLSLHFPSFLFLFSNKFRVSSVLAMKNCRRSGFPSNSKMKSSINEWTFEIYAKNWVIERKTATTDAARVCVFLYYFITWGHAKMTASTSFVVSFSLWPGFFFARPGSPWTTCDDSAILIIMISFLNQKCFLIGELSCVPLATAALF